LESNQRNGVMRGKSANALMNDLTLRLGRAGGCGTL
jgi:hypothetical protein